ncbi:MAG: ATP-dependent RNA helicase DbpA [Halobacteriovoraceae bacterium]|nr:ATP-dependent RNA helicase DbpA [Halobacteriovoraceae bacterium]
MSFNELALDPRLVKNLGELNFTLMTPIQKSSLPHLLNDKDMIAQAETGSGKTLAFGLGILNKIKVKNTRPQSLVLCPTRELAEQVATELRKIGRLIPNIKVLTITGGKSEYQQERSLAHGAHIVVGTTGRVRKLLNRKVLNLEFVETYVLDEADRMLDMGFIEDIEEITDYLPREHQTLLFSATFPDNIKELSQQIQRDDVIHVQEEVSEKDLIEEVFFRLDDHKEKTSALLTVLGEYQPQQFIIFCKTKVISDSVARELAREGIEVEPIHGDLDQRDRTSVLSRFANGSINGLVATDVAARGIDVKGLDLVVNLDLPFDPEVYVHRIGRTGRAGEKGVAVSFYIPKEEELFDRISDFRNAEFKVQNINDCESHPYDIKPFMKTLFISGGKRDKLRPTDIVGAIVGEAKIDFEAIGKINIFPVYSYVAIKLDQYHHVLKSLERGKIKNRKFKVGHVR